MSTPAFGLRAPDMTGDDSGAIALYTFDEAGGTVAHDTSGVAPALDLKMSIDGNLPTQDGTTIRTNAVLQNGALFINPKPNGSESGMADQGYQSAQRHRTFLVSDVAASKLSQCTSGFTIQAFARPWFPFQGSNSGNLIVGLTNSEGMSTVANPNFGLYQTGQTGTESATLRIRTGDTSIAAQTSVTGAFLSTRETENPGHLTELIATQESNGTLTVYVNRIARSSLGGSAPVFAAGAKLIIGNELVPLSVNAKDGTTNVDQQRNWSGEIHHLAIYCKGFTRAQILGDVAASKVRADVVKPQPASVKISSSRRDALRLVERLTGVTIPVDHPILARVEAKLLNNDRLGAAKIVTGDTALGEAGHPEFLNTVVKQLAMKMSNREETIRAPLNDFAASFIGITRDDRSAKELLTGNFFYMGDPNKVRVRSDLFKDILVSNNHYDDLEKGNWDIGKVLVRVAPDAPLGAIKGQQLATDVTGKYADSPDPAGVITSRAFMSSHAIAGTNRRLVEYAFREFLCVPMSEMADTSASPARIGRDVDRTPAGDGVKFETSCKGCHTVMDGFRGAFAFYDFANMTVNNSAYGFTRSSELTYGSSFAFGTKDLDKNRVVYKMNHNETVFPNGYQIDDNSFLNNAVGTANKPLFGWTGSQARGGVGVNQFGQMIADSTRFSQCMAKRVFETVCAPGQKSEARVTPLVAGIATKFKDGGYKMKTLFQKVAASPACAAMMSK